MFYDQAIVEARAMEPICFKVREFVIVHLRMGAGLGAGKRDRVVLAGR